MFSIYFLSFFVLFYYFRSFPCSSDGKRGAGMTMGPKNGLIFWSLNSYSRFLTCFDLVFFVILIVLELAFMLILEKSDNLSLEKVR
jgi:hypothetical protein